MNYELRWHSTLNTLAKFIIFNSSFMIFLSSCSLQRQIAKSASKDVLDAVPFQTAHVGISIYEPATNKYWYDYQGDKYFIPASNIKIPTCYAAMKYLGDSLVGLRYSGSNKTVVIEATGDPTFLHPDFKTQKVYNFLSQIEGNIRLSEDNWNENPLGSGWSWDDYNESYMAERSAMPVYGNMVRISGRLTNLKVAPVFFKKYIRTDPPWNDSFYASTATRRMQANDFLVCGRMIPQNDVIKIPFHTREPGTLYRLFKDTLKNIKEIVYAGPSYQFDFKAKIYSQPTDSVLKPMMHRSDNFFAEQTLLMVSNERLGIMDDEKIIDTLLKTDLKELPQLPLWVDGSGLSRYNLFSPKDLVFILNKMKNEFGMERVKNILPTGGQGTLANYYLSDSNYIYAKTGTLSGVVALSGYLYTKKGKELIFSVLVNNHQASGTEVRRAVEKFLQAIRKKY
jgi:serine-type D-Ala-D-Ala carboxypeptidase/endopeptidase (penicillin-binding protein 4)